MQETRFLVDWGKSGYTIGDLISSEYSGAGIGVRKQSGKGLVLEFSRNVDNLFGFQN